MDLTELATIANRELKKHGLSGWTFGLANTKRRLGVCKYRTKRIEISEYYAQHSPAEAVMDTLQHEIAHALAGHAAGHGPIWKAIAVRLGATPLACDTSKQTVVKPGDWQAICPACKKTYHRYKTPVSLTGYRCRCAARESLVFEYAGDPARRPTIPLNRERSAPWEAICAGCKTVHRRHRRPRAGRWLCKCPHRCEITWQYRRT